MSESPETLPVAPFEHYMLADDRPGHPMTFYLRFTFEGILEDERFLKALAGALPRHPLFCARLTGDPRQRTRDLAWTLPPESERGALPFVEWQDEGDSAVTDEEVSRRILDLSKEMGLRFRVSSSDGLTTVLMEIHHAVSDGLGALRFFEDVLVLYAGDPDALRPLEPARLEKRLTLGEDAHSLKRRLGRDAKRVVKFFKARPQELASMPGAKPFTLPPASVDIELTTEDTLSLKQTARLAGVTLNDLLLRDLFLSLDEWNRRIGRRRRVRIAVATNLREVGDDAMPAANLVSMVFLDRSGPELDDPRGLLASISSEMRYIKEFRMGVTLARVAALAGKLPRGMQGLVGPFPFRCCASAVLSNLGVPLATWRLPRQDGKIKAGDLLLQRVELLSPVRPGTIAAFGVVTYADRMSITLHYDATRLSASEAQSLLDLYRRHLAANEAPVKRSRGPDFDKWRKIRAELPPLRSLPIGKHVSPDEPVMPSPLPLPPASKDTDDEQSVGPARKPRSPSRRLEFSL